MAKKKGRGPTRRRESRRGAGRLTGMPDTSVLARYAPTDTANAHPDWMKKGFPEYIAPHAGHESTAVREFSHAGHVVRILTTYRVEVDGRPVRAHLSVDEDGQVYTHATPFVTYGSAIDLMKAVIDGYPDSFTGGGGGTGNHDHGHGHGRRR